MILLLCFQGQSTILIGKFGGSLHDPRGTTILSFAWGLGQASNNLVEAYVSLCGLILTKEVNVRVLFVFGDLMIVIKAMLGNPFQRDVS
jgi:hypothetical protein